jgi:3-oxoacyl-[acyl-carrier-protein] synthase III
MEYSPSRARITAIGTHVPRRIMTNHDLAQMVDTSDEWIVQRAGIRERRIAEPDEFTSDLCVHAVEDLVARYQGPIEDIDFIIACTTTPDYACPSVACQIQDRIGIRTTGAIDLNAACAGFVYGLHLANAVITAGLHRKVLVVAGDTLSKVVDYKDRATCVLFGDGAGAVLVEREEEVPSFLAAHVGSEGQGSKYIYITGISRRIAEPDQEGGLLRQNGREVFKWAVRAVSEGIVSVMEQAGLSLDGVDWFIPHSANLRIIEAICRKTLFPLERTLYSIVQYGNTSTATIPLALDQGIRAGKIRNGDKILLYGFGSGLVHAGLLVLWSAS